MEQNILEKFSLLPPEQQEQIVLFILFLFDHYVEKQLVEVETPHFTISESTQTYLDRRLEELEKMPEKRYRMVEMRNEFSLEKFKQKQERVSGNV